MLYGNVCRRLPRGDYLPIIIVEPKSIHATRVRPRRWTVLLLDIDDTPAINDPYRSAKAGFLAARTILRAASGEGAVASAYHAGLVAPFCMAATRDYFQSTLSH
jgi:hypothetical protein